MKTPRKGKPEQWIAPLHTGPKTVHGFRVHGLPKWGEFATYKRSAWWFVVELTTGWSVAHAFNFASAARLAKRKMRKVGRDLFLTTVAQNPVINPQFALSNHEKSIVQMRSDSLGITAKETKLCRE